MVIQKNDELLKKLLLLLMWRATSCLCFAGRAVVGKEKMSKERRELFSQLATHGQVGLVFVCSIMVGFGIGWYLDQRVFDGRTAPWFMFTFLAFGIWAGFKNLWGVVKRELQNKK